MSPRATYPIDTGDESDVFVIMRKVHWYVDDLIANHLHRRGIRTAERRVLDALYFSHHRGAEEMPTPAICELVPTLPPQTAASVLARLESRRRNADETDGANGNGRRRGKASNPPEGLVAASQSGRTKFWRLTETGIQTRAAYCKDVERQLQVFYDSRKGRASNPLLDRVPAALDYINVYLNPSVDRSVSELRPNLVPTSPWSGLRRVHLYVSDSLYHAMRLTGVGPVERRVLDAIGYARKHKLDGLNLGTICRLNDALTRPVAQTAINRLVNWGWLKRIENDMKEHSTGRVLWSLTAKGDQAREAYKRRTILLLREVFDPEGNGRKLADLIKAAHDHRDGRLLPGLDYLKYAT